MRRTVHLDELPYSPDSGELLDRVRDLPGAALLDSSAPRSVSGRYDIITAAPCSDGLPPLPAKAGEEPCREYFDDLGRYLRERYLGIQPAAADIPFCGGLLGYLPYDLGNGLHGVTHPGAAAVPGVARSTLQAYDWCLLQDHLLRRAVLVALPWVSPSRRRDLLARLRRPPAHSGAGFVLETPFVSDVSEEQYRVAFDRIQAYIRDGDCYQVNLAQRLRARYSGDPWSAYRVLRRVAAAPFGAYLELPDGGAILSLSPERFLALHGHHVETSPIKGTRPRHAEARSDRRAAEALRASEKDRAENLMIVDLLRNDLGRSCVPGSIHVDRLFELQSFPTVHHLVSTVIGELRSDRQSTDLLRDSFPGGSITGAPKRRAMEIIAELEPAPREVYCGSILYISADGRMDSNIAIRTLLCRDGEIRCWAGGGIVADSRWEQEYQETFDKVGRLLESLEQL
ncbi:MAG: aminodeoxychorismate synthase component I [Halioglobus sp.]